MMLYFTIMISLMFINKLGLGLKDYSGLDSCWCGLVVGAANVAYLVLRNGWLGFNTLPTAPQFVACPAVVKQKKQGVKGILKVDSAFPMSELGIDDVHHFSPPPTMQSLPPGSAVSFLVASRNPVFKLSLRETASWAGVVQSIYRSTLRSWNLIYIDLGKWCLDMLGRLLSSWDGHFSGFQGLLLLNIGAYLTRIFMKLHTKSINSGDLIFNLPRLLKSFSVYLDSVQ